MEQITWKVPVPGEDNKEYELLEEDTYAATLWSIKTVDKPDWMQRSDAEKKDYDPGHYDPAQWEWIFELADPEYEALRLSSYTNRSLHPKSNGFRFLLPLLGRAPEPGEDITITDLVGRPCKITVKIRQKKDGSEYNKITDVLAPRGKRQPMPLPTPDEFGTDVGQSLPPTGSAATEKQIKAVYSIGRAARRMSEGQVNDRCVEVWGVLPTELTKAEASQFIDMLKGDGRSELFESEEPYADLEALAEAQVKGSKK